MSGKRSRNKGASGEREAANMLAELTGVPWRRAVGQFRSGADLPDVQCEVPGCDLWVEVKRQKQPNIRAALEQAEQACGEKHTPIALTRKDRGPWLLTLRAENLWDFFEELEALKAEAFGDGA